MWFSESECNILMNNRLMECWQYVCGISWHKLFRSHKCFEGHLGKIVDEVNMNFTNEEN